MPHSSSLTRVRLVYQDRAVNLLHGTYLIGRGPQCHVVLDDPRVSRMHARVIVDRAGVSIEDCGSVNGVYVNGERIEQLTRLESGDSVVIGDNQLSFELSAPDLPPMRAVSDTMPEPETPVPPADRGPVTTDVGRQISVAHPSVHRLPSEDSYSTARASALELLGGVAERALAAGDAAQAEAVVHARLIEVLDFVRARHAIDPELSQRALRLSLELSRQLRARRWLDYALDLLTALAIPCAADVVRQMRVARAAAGPPDPERLAAYGRCVRALPMSLDKVRTVALLDDLAG